MLTDAIHVCDALAQAGIWLQLHPDTQSLILGPTPIVQAHPELLQQVRDQKAHILTALRETLAAEVVSAPEASRFELETCPACQQPSFVILAPRRLAVHRLPGGQTVCPGAIQAQEAVADTLMTRFITQRCLERPQAVLTWMALRGGIEGWARDQGWLLPPRQYLIAWMDRHYERMSADEIYASWKGLTFTVEEWLGTDEDVPPPATVEQPRRLVLKAS
jgi:hypothetical protein